LYATRRHPLTALSDELYTHGRRNRRGGLVIKGVPAEVCENCGGAYVDEATTGALLDEIKTAASLGVDIEVRRYAAA
jgi:YgiT-type zinc finger domain-containing protein